MRLNGTTAKRRGWRYLRSDMYIHTYICPPYNWPGGRVTLTGPAWKLVVHLYKPYIYTTYQDSQLTGYIHKIPATKGSTYATLTLPANEKFTAFYST